MFLDKFLRKCQFRYETGDFQTLISLLRYNLREASPKYQSVMESNKKFNQIKQQFLHDNLAYQDYKTTENQITEELKKVIDSLRESDLRRKANAIHREVRESIFVVVSNPEKIEETKLLFDLLNFTKKEVVFLTDFQETETDIIIFENRTLEEQNAPEVISLMNQYLENQKYIIHFGEKWNWVEENKNQVVWAKSKIELNARLNELVKFMEAYRT